MSMSDVESGLVEGGAWRMADAHAGLVVAARQAGSSRSCPVKAVWPPADLGIELEDEAVS